MTKLPDRFIDDRAMRDAARAVLAEDIERLRTSLGEEGIASRVSSGVSSTISTRIRSGARDVLDQAKAQAGDHKGVLAILIGAIILWFGRGPILEWIEELDNQGSETEDDLNDAAVAAAAIEGDPE
ncbi:MAG: hypothetical protein EAY70_12855 [Sphingomonadales bacterium]|nr:MAG: hypothetical protein EAY70_12855 [Sphingomonadales bacterium]